MKRSLHPPKATRQVSFHELLIAARKTWTVDALHEALARIEPNLLKKQLSIYAPNDIQKILASLGIRDEEVIPTPIVLESQPTLVGYYRLLTGVSQKGFYSNGTGMGPFQRMENGGTVTPITRKLLPKFCKEMSSILSDLIRSISPALSARDLHELQLLTLGSNFYGSINNTIGIAATKGILEAISDIYSRNITNHSPRSLTIATSFGRTYSVVLSSDPDVAIQETTEGRTRNLLSIEIKGGSDASNVYNRGGEAEKSHQGAKQRGFLLCWTIIRTSGIDFDKLKRGSPTTDSWFDTAQILAHKGDDWENFRSKLISLVEL